MTSDRRLPPLSHLVGLALLAASIPWASNHAFSALTLSVLTTTVLIVVAGWESMAFRQKTLVSAATDRRT